MKGKIKFISRKPANNASAIFTAAAAKEAYEFHKTLSEYKETPLADLKELAKLLGVSAIYVKDESQRFGLNAFKVLGGSYSISRYMQKAGSCHTFVTATDGNHGRGVAWAAQKMHCRCVVYLPKGSAAERVENIKALGAEAFVTDWNYDDTVRFACRQAEENGWTLVQDTSWEGYEEIPKWIMQGYTTMGWEITHQLEAAPTHVFLQAGVGAMAGAMCGFLADYYGSKCPVIAIVEPDRADCIFRTAEADDGSLHKVGGSLATMMAGLACGEPCPLGWKQIRAYAGYYASVPDEIAAKGMRVLGNPEGKDSKVISGESGAVTLGFVYEILNNPEFADIKNALKLDKESRILCISTEGDTDRANYRRIVWDALK